MSVLDYAKKLNKAYKDDKYAVISSIMPNYERLPSKALGFSYCLGGGLPLGRIVIFSGLPHSGKTLACGRAIADYQAKFPDKICVYIDAEHSFDLDFQEKMNGINRDKLLYINPSAGNSAEQICDDIIGFQKEPDIGMIVLDSIPALLPAASLENDMTKDVGLRGSVAKILYRFLAQMTGMVNEKNNIFILVNQVRDDGKTFSGIQRYKESGGMAPQFYSSVSVRFGQRKWTLGDDMDACGKEQGVGADGIRISFKVTKNKTFNCTRGGGFLTYRFATGLDWLHDLIEVALAFNFIPRLNNVTYQLVNLETNEVLKDENGNDLIGKKADLVEYIRTHEEFQKWYIDMLNKHISGTDKSFGNLLDAETSKAIDAEQNAIESTPQSEK